MNQQTLQEAIDEYIQNHNNDNSKKTFGEYKEKMIHGILKCYFEKNINNREVQVGTFYADIKNEKGIFEIQTRLFDKLRSKLNYYLKEGKEVYIVHPLIKNKNIIYINLNSGQKTCRKSPVHASYFTPFKELYKIKPYLKCDNLHFIFIYLDVTETKKEKLGIQNRKKRLISSSKYPENINDIIYINNINDYRKLLVGINGEFTSKSLAKQTKSRIKEVMIALNVLYYLNIVERIGKIGRFYNYKIKE